MFNPFKKEEIVQEVLMAYRWRFPEKLEVSLQSSKDGGYVACVKDFPGCITQAENSQEIFEMMHDAIYTYLQIPSRYQPYMPIFFPPEELRKQLKIKIPDKFLRENIVLQRT